MGALTYFFQHLISWLMGFFNLINGIVIDSYYGIEIRFGWLLIGFIVLSMITSLFWKGARG